MEYITVEWVGIPNLTSHARELSSAEVDDINYKFLKNPENDSSIILPTVFTQALQVSTLLND